MSTEHAIDRRELGKEAEQEVRAYLQQQGVQVILENFRCRIGELDLVALHGKVLVVVEVRLRSGSEFGTAAESVGPRKRARIAAATRYLLLTRSHFRRYPVRFDVVALDRDRMGDPTRIRWIKGAFQVEA